LLVLGLTKEGIVAMERIVKQIKCKCGALLGTTSNSSGGGQKVCPSCKKRVRYQVTPTSVHTSYIK